MSYSCRKCDAYFSEWNSEYLCSECRRNEDFARQQAETQREVERAAHLNEIKRKLLDLAIEGLEDRDGASKKIAVLMRSSDFAGNLGWFWSDIAANPLLLDVYFEGELAPLAGKSLADKEVVEFYDGLSYYAQKEVGQWLSRQPADGRWRETVLSYQKYERVLQDRAAEQRRQSDEYARRNAEEKAAEQKERAEQAARDSKREKSALVFSHTAAVFCVLLFAGGFLFGGSWKLTSWSSDALYLPISIFGILWLVAVVKFWSSSRTYTFECWQDKHWRKQGVHGFYATKSYVPLIQISVAGLFLFLTWRSWSSIEGPARIALVAAAAGFPFIPFLRGVLASFSLGIAGGLLSLLAAYIAGGVLSGIYGWIMTSKG